MASSSSKSQPIILGGLMSEVTYSYSRSLSEILEDMLQWRSRPDLVHDQTKIPWTESHLSVILGYVLKLEGNKFHFSCANMGYDQVWHHSFEPHNYKKFAKMVVSFTQELQEFFMVPKLQQFSLKKNELVAVFTSFLLQLLDYETESIASYEDRIAYLQKELRFLVTVLGDTLLLGAEVEQVQNLLADFEEVANEAGSLVHSFIFTTDRPFKSIQIDKALDDLFDHINLLKANIVKLSNLLPFIIGDHMNPKTAAVDSLFIVDSLLYDLGDLTNQEDDRIVNVQDQIKILHQVLMLSQPLLKDIKLPPHSDIEDLKETMRQIRDVAYGAEYLINSFLVGDAPLWYLTIRLPDVIHKTKLVGNELQEIKKSYDIGALKVANNPMMAQLSLQAKRNSEVNDITVGLEEKTTNILYQLVGGTEHQQIITIFGMPGIGKTTLAKKLYNHPTVSYHFHKRSWCIVSQTYQRKILLIDILIRLGSEIDKVKILNMEEESLAEHIYKNLKGRRYLIVMDDIWISYVWDDLRRYFPDDENGSRILFTSRNKNVAPPNSIIYTLSCLPYDQCWELLEKKVFHNKPCPPHLLGVGKKIAANCRGLPLAVVVVAGILSTVDKEEITWKIVGRSLASLILSDKNNSMMQILNLSYKHLPEHLKPCFLYFGAFPEDTEVPVKKLKCLWIAEGFIHKEEKKSPENVAEEYLMELIDKSLVIVSQRKSDSGVKTCVIHDLLRDLCLRIADEEHFLKLVDDNNSIYTKHHRLCVHMNPISEASRPQLWLPFSHHVRSFSGSLHSSLYLLKMKLLRVLDLPNNTFSNIHGIELLVNLRYLAIDKYIPASIDSLVNLEFLIVNGIFGGLHPIPSAIQKLLKLRYLRVPLANFDIDWNSSQRNNLEFLSSIFIKKLKDEEMLKSSPHLRKLKCRCRPFWDEKGSYRYPDLRFLTQLESLSMMTLLGRARAEINFPSSIEKLSLDGLWLPWKKMSIIGELPNLQVLKLANDAFVGERWETKDGEFQQLKFLKIYGLNLAQWNVASSEHFPKLQRLMLHKCFYLQEIPCEMGEIATLQLIEVELCPKSVGESAIQIQEEQRDMGNEELRVIIGGEF